MPQEFRNPLGILHIRFAAGDSLDMLGIDHKQFTMAFEQIIDWTPVDSRAFHSDVGTARILEPVGESQ
jgi:hypothetical protein